MTERAGTGPIDCLPATLREAGFSTTYLQAAPLPFMMKDQFMAQAGFDRVLGDDWFTTAHNRNHWGVDDRTRSERQWPAGGLGPVARSAAEQVRQSGPRQ